MSEGRVSSAVCNEAMELDERRRSRDRPSSGWWLDEGGSTALQDSINVLVSIELVRSRSTCHLRKRPFRSFTYA